MEKTATLPQTKGGRMLRGLILIVALTCCIELRADITRVFIALDGNDTNSGMLQAPKATLRAALDGVPFPSAGRDTVVLYIAQGTYADGLVLRENDVRRGQAERSVWIIGQGHVVLDGTTLQRVGIQGILTMRGPSPRVENVHLVNSSVAGLTVEFATDVVVRNVHVDRCPSHGITITHCRGALVDSCSLRETVASEVGVPTRTWGSGYKLFMSTDVVLQHSRATRTWGEAINVNRCERVVVRRNTVDASFSGAIYIDMGAVVLVEGNVIRQDLLDTALMRFKGTTAAGISMCNELHCAFNVTCDPAIWTGTDNCRYRCQGIGCEFLVRMNDSIDVINNVLIHCGSGLELFELFNGECSRNIRFAHNTVVHPNPPRPGAGITILADHLFHDVQNLRIDNNLFLIGPGPVPARADDNPLASIVPHVRGAGNVFTRVPEWVLSNVASIVSPTMPVDTARYRPTDDDRLAVVVDAVPYVSTDIDSSARGPVTTAGAYHRAVASHAGDDMVDTGARHLGYVDLLGRAWPLSKEALPRGLWFEILLDEGGRLVVQRIVVP
jgi:hypothetical protein